jgi:hypothetical protein
MVWRTCCPSDDYGCQILLALIIVECSMGSLGGVRKERGCSLAHAMGINDNDYMFLLVVILYEGY